MISFDPLSVLAMRLGSRITFILDEELGLRVGNDLAEVSGVAQQGRRRCPESGGGFGLQKPLPAQPRKKLAVPGSKSHGCIRNQRSAR